MWLLHTVIHLKYFLISIVNSSLKYIPYFPNIWGFSVYILNFLYCDQRIYSVWFLSIGWIKICSITFHVNFGKYFMCTLSIKYVLLCFTIICQMYIRSNLFIILLIHSISLLIIFSYYFRIYHCAYEFVYLFCFSRFFSLIIYTSYNLQMK